MKKAFISITLITAVLTFIGLSQWAPQNITLPSIAALTPATQMTQAPQLANSGASQIIQPMQLETVHIGSSHKLPPLPRAKSASMHRS